MAKKCGNCKNCEVIGICGEDCRCKAKSEEGLDFYVSADDDIGFYGERSNEPCCDYRDACYRRVRA